MLCNQVSRWTAGLGLLIAFAVIGCNNGGGQFTTGYTEPVTAKRLVDKQLTDIRRSVTWSFTHDTVTIDNDGEQLPVDVMETLGQPQMEVKQVTANWKLRKPDGQLYLTNMKFGEQQSGLTINIPIAGAGPIRADIGGRQYNFSSPY